MTPAKKFIVLLCLCGSLTGWSRQTVLVTKGFFRRPQPKTLGLTLLIEFSDQTKIHSKSVIEDWLNGDNFTQFGCNGSIRQFYLDVSNSRLEIINQVFGYYMAKKPKSYYDEISSYGHVNELVKETMAYFDASIDFSRYDNNKDGIIDVINFVYAGTGKNFGKGIWPHLGWYSGQEKYDGVKVQQFQFSDTGDKLTLYVFAHETGHLLFGWPDLYGTGNQGLMGSRMDDPNPAPPCDVLRADQGWLDVIDLKKEDYGTYFSLKNDNAVYRFINPEDPAEYFLWVNRAAEGRYQNARVNGIQIYHFTHRLKNNNPPEPLLLDMEQADGKFELNREKWPSPGSDPKDLFYQGSSAGFTPGSKPSSNWQSGKASGLSLTQFSPVGDEMHFNLNADITCFITSLESQNTPIDTLFPGWTGELRYSLSSEISSISTEAEVAIEITGRLAQTSYFISRQSLGQSVIKGKKIETGRTVVLPQSGFTDSSVTLTISISDNGKRGKAVTSYPINTDKLTRVAERIVKPSWHIVPGRGHVLIHPDIIGPMPVLIRVFLVDGSLIYQGKALMRPGRPCQLPGFSAAGQLVIVRLTAGGKSQALKLYLP